MDHLLKQISEKAIELGDFEFTQEQIKNKWLGHNPTTKVEINLKEKKLGIELPTDYKELLLLTNGFSAANNIEPTFLSLNKIDYLRNIDHKIIEAYSIDGIENVGRQLKESIIIGGINEEQYFLLIPPTSTTTKWKYWKFANWHPGEEEYNGLKNYFEQVLNFLIKTKESKRS